MKMIFTISLLSLSLLVNAQVLDLETSLRNAELLKLTISFEKDTFDLGEEIMVSYTLKNVSEEFMRLLMKESMGFPNGMSANVFNSSRNSIVKYPSWHILSSQVYMPEERDFKILGPKESIKGMVKLQDIPVFENYIKKIPSGNYTASITFQQSISNEVSFVVVDYK